MDFDKEQAEEEALAVIGSCEQYHITPLAERSQSGNGIHIWIFFGGNIPAHKARNLGNLLLTHAMMHSPNLNFTAYDRLIPMQDTLPNSGFGNLIALPLKWENVQKGCSTFLDNQLNLVPLNLIWQHLSQIPYYKEQEVMSLIEKIQSDTQKEEYHSVKSEEISLFDEKEELPHLLKVVRANELIIPKEGLTRKQQIQLMYLATFKNPKFYKAQRRRQPVWNIPRLITSSSEDKQTIYLPRGVEDNLKQKIPNMVVEDETNAGNKIEVKFTGNLFPEQMQAVLELLKCDTGILSARTGFGKTVVAAKIIESRKVSTLILVHNEALAHQWLDSLHNFLQIDSEPFKEYTKTGRLKRKDKIGLVFGAKNQQSKLVDIVSISKLAKLSELELRAFFNAYGQIIIDECHHIAAYTFEQVIKQASSRYILGLSATPDREDGLTPILFMRCGSLRYQSEAQQNKNILLKEYLYPRYTSIGELDAAFEIRSYSEQLAYLVEVPTRNQQIIKDIVTCFQQNRTSLVLSERYEHIQILEKMLDKAGIKSFQLTGRGSKKSNREIVSELRQLKESFVLLATSKYAGEGFDLPQLDTLFLTLPFKAKNSHKQYLGRLQRNLENKAELRVYDYVDISNPIFAGMYQKRLKTYQQAGYEIAEDEETRKFQTGLFDENNYLMKFKEDILKASKVYLIIPKVSNELIELLSQKSGLAVSIQTLGLDSLRGKAAKIQENSVALLKKNLGQVKLAGHIFQTICIIDASICWYGNLQFLSPINNDKTTLRIVSEKLAEKMKSQIL